MTRPEVETLSSAEVYRNRWMTVREDRVRRADGSEGLYGVVSKPDFAVILPWDGGGLTLVQQYRYPVGHRSWELPAGTWEQGGLGPEALARAELAEETGLTAGRIDHLGFLHLACGYSTQGYHVFLATDLVQGGRNLDAEEVGLICRRFPLSEVRGMILSGEITDATTVAALSLWELRGRPGPT